MAKKKAPSKTSAQKYSDAVSKQEYDKKVSGAYKYRNSLIDALSPKGSVWSVENRRKIASNRGVQQALANLLVADMVTPAGWDFKKGTPKKGFRTKNLRATTYGQGKKSMTNVAVLNADRARGILSGQASLKRKRGGVAE